MSTIALVTGANRGIGKEVCRQLAERGFEVLLSGRDIEKAKASAAEIGLKNINPAQLDVTDETSIKRLAAYVTERYGRLDVLVNNAGGHYDYWQTALTADFATVREAAETNLYGPWHVTQAFVPAIAAERSSAHRQRGQRRRFPQQLGRRPASLHREQSRASCFDTDARR